MKTFMDVIKMRFLTRILQMNMKCLVLQLPGSIFRKRFGKGING